jgi:pimeloyl-ACP methyl ester carboxylesterase
VIPYSPLPAARRFFSTLACTIIAGHAAVSSGLSPAITVDTRDTNTLVPLHTKLIEKTSAQGHTLVRRQSPDVGLSRNKEKPAYLVVEIPRFESKGGGWASRTEGLGAFHGFEIVYQGEKNDRIYQKIGGQPPSSSTPDREWIPVSANRVLNETIRSETRYFKVVFAEGGAKTAKFAVRFHSARFTDGNSAPVTQLDSKNDIWLVFHDKNGGSETLAALHYTLRNARSQDQVITIDWASAATTHADWPQPADNASYFRNIGQNLAQLLKQQGFNRKKINLIGHGWGAVVAYETAARLGGSHHLIALDPSANGAGAFDDRSIRLSRVSNISTSIKSGTRKKGALGNESIATTADYSIRLLSQSHNGDPENAVFHHALPIDWSIQVLSSTTGPYWPFLKDSILLRSNAQPELPWSATGTLPGGFDLECLGHTQYDMNASSPDDMSTMDKITYLAFLRNKHRTIARAKLTQDGETTWTYSRK